MPITKEDLPQLLSNWPTDIEAATQLQEQLRHKVERTDRLDDVKTVAGLDLGFVQEGTMARAAAVLLSFPDLRMLEHAIIYHPVSFPYIPGFLSFREVPAALMALTELSALPDLLICDGQGIAHPRRFGLACHIGVLADIPAIGCAKSILVGRWSDALGNEKGDTEPLIHQGEQVGVALRSRTGTKPLFVSPGHRISLETSIRYVLACLTRYRLPETTRLADKIASNRGGAADNPEGLQQRLI